MNRVKLDLEQIDKQIEALEQEIERLEIEREKWLTQTKRLRSLRTRAVIANASTRKPKTIKKVNEFISVNDRVDKDSEVRIENKYTIVLDRDGKRIHIGSKI